MASKSVASLNTLRNLFIDGWKYILEYGPTLGKADILTILFLIKEAQKPDLTLEQLGALAVLSVSVPGSNFGFKPIEPLSEDPAQMTCFQFGQGRVGWYFMYGNSNKPEQNSKTDVGFTFIVFRIELAPPEVVKAYKLNPSEAVIYSIVAGCGKSDEVSKGRRAIVDNKCKESWRMLPKTLVRARYRCLSSETFDFTVVPEKDSSLKLCKLRSREPGFFQINTEWIDPNTKEQIEIYANLRATKPAVYNGIDGCVPCINGLGSLYWSYTNMKVKMNVGNPKYVSESHIGTGWFDHQWTASSTSSTDPQVERWLWLTLQLFNETQYMIVVTGFKDSDIRKGHIFDAILVNKYTKDAVKYNIGNTKVEVLDTVLVGVTVFPTKYKITITEDGQSNIYILKNAFGESLVNMFTGSLNWEGPGNTYNQDESKLIGLGFLEANQLQSGLELVAESLQPLLKGDHKNI